MMHTCSNTLTRRGYYQAKGLSYSALIIPKKHKSTISSTTPISKGTTTTTTLTTKVQPTFMQRLSNSFSYIRSSFLNAEVTNPKKSDIPPSFVGKTSDWNNTIAEAEKLVQNDGKSYIDPVMLVGRDLTEMTKNIQGLLGSGHPLLHTVSEYYFTSEGKHIRPLLVLLMSQATSVAEKQYNAAETDFYQITDKPLSHHLSSNTEMLNSSKDPSIYRPSLSSTGTIIFPTQRRLAEITEMIHTASLLHDDVVDNSDTRRNNPSANFTFGNKMAILAGDFLLARASIALARLRNPEVIELLATAIANLVEGEFMQLKNIQENGNMPTFEFYMEKTYMKTASLIAKSCRAATILGGATIKVCDIAYTYGRNLGLAFQLIDDMLDFVVTSKELGKPVGADLRLGLATAPVLYACEEYPELGPLIKRNFSREGDVEKTRILVYKSNGIEKTKLLASSHCQKAIVAISQLPESDARNALIQLTQKVLTREK